MFKLDNFKNVERGDKIILYGPGAVGKSFSLATILASLQEGRRFIYVMVENNALGGLEAGLKHYKYTPKPGQLVIAYPEDTSKAFSNLNRALKEYSKQNLAEAKRGDPKTNMNKDKYGYLSKIIECMESFTGVDPMTGEKVVIGNIGDLTADDILAVDGLTPIVAEVWDSVTGDKIEKSEGDYMPAQQLLLSIFRNLEKITCGVILLAHEQPIFKTTIENGKEKVTEAGVKLHTGVGTANYESLIGRFQELIHCTGGVRYVWDTDGRNADARTRKMPKGNMLTPDFAKYGLFGLPGKK